MGGVVNTFLKAFDAYAIKITVDGQPAESGHNIYSEYLHFYRPNPGSLEESIYSSNREEAGLHHTFFWMRDGAFIFQYPSYASSVPTGTYERERMTKSR